MPDQNGTGQTVYGHFAGLVSRNQESVRPTVQAGMIAKKAGVKQLLIGHFSSKYEDLMPFLSETKAIFEPTILAEEGSCIRIQVKENV
jgi:ribonuclease Z